MIFWDKLADPSHPIWTHIKVIIITCIILVVFQFGYSHGLGTVDIMPIVTIILSLYGVNIGQEIISSLISSQKKP